MNYWEECIICALEEAGIEATKEQINIIAGCVEGAHENYGMAYSHNVIPNPLLDEVRKAKDTIKKQQDYNDKIIHGIKIGVAKRRNVDVSDVSIDERGHVTYRP